MAEQRAPVVLSIGSGAGYYKCSEAVKIGRPTSTEELLALIQGFPRVKGVGVGHSWWQQSFCAGNDSSAIQIVLTELPATRFACVSLSSLAHTQTLPPAVTRVSALAVLPATN